MTIKPSRIMSLLFCSWWVKANGHGIAIQDKWLVDGVVGMKVRLV